MQELVSAANIVGLFDNKVFGRRAPNEWTVLVVLTVDRTSDENAVTAEYLDSGDGETTTFACRSEFPIFDAGDFINMRGDEISFVHKEALRPVFFQIGGTVTVPASPAEEPRAAPPPPPPGGLQLRRPRLIPAGAKSPIEEAHGPMTEAEMIHFNSDKADLGKLFGKLEPIVRAYAREHTRKPRDVARRLNAEGHRTANDAVWTPRLVRFLLALMFNDSKRGRSSKPQTQAQPPPNQQGSHRKLPPVAMDDKSEIAKRLSALGKVTVRPRN
ncbi:hypothetical protein [Bradyrhizobium symbiodeficiens]|uniref:hypothetical protein n=1 Tax=Bradyrhizobium symbiodeficiens TaxID=1404367 RepID=UPI00140FBFAB|nr:hypothetical protein [Bradyrhizobium symbiodeficiens]QIP02976.1 hypothetical protein HAU86_25725 [Bradyrhizobium symbiodeficiens]